MTNKQVLSSINYVNAFMHKFADIDTPIQRKLKQKTLKSFQAFADDYNDALDNLRLKNCLKGDKGEILKDDKGNYHFSEEGTIALKAAVKELLTKEADADIYKVDYDMFSADEKLAFDLTDSDIYDTCSIFIAGLPNNTAL